MPATRRHPVVWLVVRLGPKFFEFDARTGEALEQFSLALPSRDYAQLFPTLMLRLPPDYAQGRVAPFTHRGTEGTHTLDWILVRHDQAVGRVLILPHMTSDSYLTKSLRIDQDGSLEEAHRARAADAVEYLSRGGDRAPQLLEERARLLPAPEDRPRRNVKAG